MYAALARSVILDEEPERLAEDLRKISRRYPHLSPEELSEKLIQRAAIRCAAVGALASVPAAWLPAFPVAADLPYQVLSLNRLARTVAAGFHRPTTGLECGIAAASSLVMAGASGWLRAGTVEIARRPLSHRAPHVLPLLAAVIGGALGYAAVRLMGALAQDYCRATGLPRARRGR